MSFSKRELEVAALIAEGLSTKEMSARLGIANATVRVHVRSLLQKLGVHSRLQISAALHRARASALARRRGGA